MSSFSTRWSVVQRHEVAPAELDADGLITHQTVERWVGLARDAYLDQCRILADTSARLGLELHCSINPDPDRAQLGRAGTVVVTASATEVLARSFVVASRLRAVGVDADPLNVTSVVRLEDPATGNAHEITGDIRDELIALEHAARYFN